jgi:hypothetical protein
MSKELDEKLLKILNLHHNDRTYFTRIAIAEIKAAILAEMPAKKTENDPYLYAEMWNGGYNQAVTEITEKLK